MFLDKPSLAAQLYRLEAGQNEDGAPAYHSVLRMPTDITKKDVDDSVKAPVIEEDPNSLTRPESTYNIIMLDTSGSMDDCIMHVVDAFNYKIAKHLDGKCGFNKPSHYFKEIGDTSRVVFVLIKLLFSSW